jgi:hypothetical protein
VKFFSLPGVLKACSLPLWFPFFGRDQFAAPAGQTGLHVMAHRDDHLGEFVRLGSQLSYRFLVCVLVANKPLRQPEQLEQGDQLRQRQSLGFLDVLERHQLFQRHLGGFAQVGCVEFLAGQADIGTLARRRS